jgi:hypothetical protein
LRELATNARNNVNRGEEAGKSVVVASGIALQLVYVVD